MTPTLDRRGALGYLDRRSGPMGEKERDKLLFWFVQAGMWGRFSGSTESFIDQDLAALEGADGGLDKLLDQLRLWHGGLRVEPGHFTGWSLGARFYPVLYLLTRMGEARDWGTGLPLKANLLGKMSRLEVHHIFPKAQLYKRKHKKPEVNALANFCFLTKDTNLDILARLPEEYSRRSKKRTQGRSRRSGSRWIQTVEGRELSRIPRSQQDVAGSGSQQAPGGTASWRTRWLEGPRRPCRRPWRQAGGITSEEEEKALDALNEWMELQGLPVA